MKGVTTLGEPVGYGCDEDSEYFKAKRLKKTDYAFSFLISKSLEVLLL
jgi:hypothetical protein